MEFLVSFYSVVLASDFGEKLFIIKYTQQIMMRMRRVFITSTIIEKPHKEPHKLEDAINTKVRDLESRNWEILDVDVILRGKSRIIVSILAERKEAT